MAGPQEQSPTQERYLGYREAGDFLGMTYEGIANAVRGERLHPVKFPGDQHKYLRLSELEAYRSKRRWAPSEPQPSPQELGRAAVALDAGAITKLVEAASGPTLEASRDILASLAKIAVATVFASAGISPDPKVRAG